MIGTSSMYRPVVGAPPEVPFSALPPTPRRVRLGLLSLPVVRKVKPGTWLDRSCTERMPCWSRFFWVTADTDRATLLTVEVWRVAVTTTSSMAWLLVGAAWANAAVARPAHPSAEVMNRAARSPLARGIRFPPWDYETLYGYGLRPQLYFTAELY